MLTLWVFINLDPLSIDRASSVQARQGMPFQRFLGLWLEGTGTARGPSANEPTPTTLRGLHWMLCDEQARGSAALAQV